MKICFICNEYPPNPAHGIGIFVKTLAEALVKLDVDVSVVGYGRKGPRPFLQNGVKIFWLRIPHVLSRSVTAGGYPYSIASLLRRHLLSAYLFRLVRTQGMDIVESHDFNGPLGARPPTKLVVRLHGSVLAYRLGEGRPAEISPMDKFYEIKQLRMADHVVAVSRYIGELTERALGNSLQYQVIHNAVDTSVFKPEIYQTDGSILFVGNIIWRKGVFDLIKALPLVLKQHPSARLKIVGGAGGAHRGQLNAALTELPDSVQEQVELLGQVPYEALPALYNKAAVFVFPSWVEAFGLTCAEAMACGRPVVVTCLASGPELVEDGISGLLADPAQPGELAEKVNRILENLNLAKSLGDQARQRILDKFALQDMGKRNLDLYQTLL